MTTTNTATTEVESEEIESPEEMTPLLYILAFVMMAIWFAASYPLGLVLVDNIPFMAEAVNTSSPLWYDWYATAYPYVATWALGFMTIIFPFGVIAFIVTIAEIVQEVVSKRATRKTAAAVEAAATATV